MLRLGKSDEDFQSAYEQYFRNIHRTLTGMTGNASLAEELAQEAFLKAWKSLSQFGFKSSLKTWIYQIALNTGKDWLRSHKHPVVIELIAENEAQPEIKAVQEALMELEEEVRFILILFYYEGMTNEEMGKVLGIPTGTVKSRLHHAKGKLLPLLQAKGFDL